MDVGPHAILYALQVLRTLICAYPSLIVLINVRDGSLVAHSCDQVIYILLPLTYMSRSCTNHDHHLLEVASYLAVGSCTIDG